MRKHVLGVSDRVGHKPSCTATVVVKGLKFQIKDLENLYYQMRAFGISKKQVFS